MLPWFIAAKMLCLMLYECGSLPCCGKNLVLEDSNLVLSLSPAPNRQVPHRVYAGRRLESRQRNSNVDFLEVQRGVALVLQIHKGLPPRIGWPAVDCDWHFSVWVSCLQKSEALVRHAAMHQLTSCTTPFAVFDRNQPESNHLAWRRTIHLLFHKARHYGNSAG